MQKHVRLAWSFNVRRSHPEREGGLGGDEAKGKGQTKTLTEPGELFFGQGFDLEVFLLHL